MFSEMFTTEMSSNTKSLQRRFSQIRSGVGKKAKAMSAVMTAAILVTTTAVTVAVAAVSGSGLESWTSNELYPRDSVAFSVNVAGKDVPNWVNEEVAGADGKVDVTISRYQTRDLHGTVNDAQLVELNGNKGKVALAAGAWSMLNKPIADGQYETNVNPAILNYEYATEIAFNEANNGEYPSDIGPISALVSEKNNRYVDVYFGVDANKEIQTAFVTFFNADEWNNVTSEMFDTFEASTFSYEGGFETAYISDCASAKNTNHYFTFFEDKFENNENENISVEIANVSTDSIDVHAVQTLQPVSPDIAFAERLAFAMFVYDEEGRLVSELDRLGRNTIAIGGIYNLTPIKSEGTVFDMSSGETSKTGREVVPENQYVPGKQYRVCVVLLDGNNTVLYRWQQYVTMK